ncbi:MAG TPA: aminotransferase class I/II-fold pyridoxal phosphate-dependent enzyme [Gemmatimonadaceae bacterium]|jgi:aspartate/methionine/tyrosine aminotransferase|nr:aminotransferase class I/II-fold pyridoxal phosphate-dependent enzyme [Gemmatimonadaceae bacterium]
MAVRESTYLSWLKALAPVRYDLAGSGVRACPLELLGPESGDWTLSGENTFGWPPLLERLAARYGVATTQIVPALATSGANHLVYAAALSEPGDHVLVERPGYEPLIALAQYHGAIVDRFDRRPEDGYRLDPDAVRRALTPRTRLIVVTNLHNPTGALASSAELGAIAAIAEAHGCRLLVDEVFREWLHDRGEPSAIGLSPAVVTTCSLTKAYGLDHLRGGWIIADATFADRVRRLVGLFHNTMPYVIERLMARALDRAQVIVGDLTPLVDRNRAAAARWIASHEQLSWVAPPAGTVGFVRVRGRNGAAADVDAMAERLRARDDTGIVPGRFFDDPGAFRVGLGGPADIVDEGLRRIGAALAH